MQAEVLSQQLLSSKDFFPTRNWGTKHLGIVFMNNAVFRAVTGIFKGCWVMNSSHYGGKNAQCHVGIFLYTRLVCVLGINHHFLRRIRAEIINL